MISIKSFLDQHRNRSVPEQDITAALTQMGRLLLEGIATYTVRGRDTDFNILSQGLNELACQIDGTQSAVSLLSISSDAVEALETYFQQTTEYFGKEKEQLHSMVAMLTDTVSDLSGQTDASVVRLQAIEKDIELASGLNDMQAVRSNLENCLLAVREAAAQQRISSGTTVQRLRDQVDTVRARIPADPKNAPFSQADGEPIPEQWDEPIASEASKYVAAFRLQRAESISSRFGESAKHQMLSKLGTQLKTVLGPDDRLLRWKGSSFIVFIQSTGTILEIKTRLHAVTKTGTQYVEVGKKSALLALGVDWIVFPQSDYASLEAVFAEVDAFLANRRQASSSVMKTR